MPNHTPDLTKHAPRSPRIRLGGFVILPRMIDKCRALLAGKNGDYGYNCPLDQRFLEITGVDPEALKEVIASGKGDGEILDWVKANSPKNPSEEEIRAWSDAESVRGPDGPEKIAFFESQKATYAPHRTDIHGWFDLLDVDDWVSFGGKA